MTDCPNCEYHRQRAQRWREEVYKLSGHPLPEREWVGLTGGEVLDVLVSVDKETVRLPSMLGIFARAIEAKLKEKNVSTL